MEVLIKKSIRYAAWNIILFPVVLFMISCNGRSSHCADNATAFIPLEDLAGKRWEGFAGGKYPEGSNVIPEEHFARGMQLSNSITKLNSDGNPDSLQGLIACLVLGYSTAAMTGNTWKTMYEMEYPGASVRIVSGAQGGMDLNTMLDANTPYFSAADSLIRKEGVSPAQVQIIWVSTGDLLTAGMQFPAACNIQIPKYRMMLRALKIRYPNLKMVLISDRGYAGYIDDAGPAMLKEPGAYYSSWTVKWLIEKQLQGEQGYTEDSIPFIDWGPCLWTNGAMGNAQGYTWECRDAGNGGIHPSERGRAKEGTLVYLYFLHHPYTATIFGNPSNGHLGTGAALPPP